MFAVAARHPTSVSVGRPFAPLAARARVASAAPLRAARAPRARARDITARAAGTIQKVTKDELEEMMKVRPPTRPLGRRPPHRMSTITLKPHPTLRFVSRHQDRSTPLVIDFFATWCGPCVLIASELEKVKAELGESVRVVKVDTDEEATLSTQLQIQGLPTLVFVGTDLEKPALRTEGMLPAEMIKGIISNEL